MWETSEPLLRMRRQPLFLLLAIAVLHTHAENQYGILINSVKIILLPGGRVQSGEDISLVCEAQISSRSQLLLNHKITFFKDDRTLHISETQDSSMSYTIKRARFVNSGKYKCRVEVGSNSKDSDPEKLTVTGLQTPILSVSSSSVLEGERVTVTCGAHNEPDSNFYFYFYENSKEISEVWRNTSEVTIELEFTAGTKYLECAYTVALMPETAQSNKSLPVTIDVNELAITPRISIWPKTGIVEGDHLEVNCSVTGGSQKVAMYLIKDNWHTIGSDTVSHKLTARVQDSGLYTCQLEIGKVQKKTSATVSVTELFSTPVLTINPPGVFETEQFNFTCYSESIAKSRITRNNVMYTFYKDGQLFKADGVMIANESLNGNYSCRAEAKGISRNSSGFVFKAKELVSTPEIGVMDKVILGMLFRIRCHCRRGYLPIRYTLMKGQDRVHSLTITQPSSYAVFNVSIKEEEDIRKFACHAQNGGPAATRWSHQLSATVIVPPSEVKISLFDAEEGNIKEGDIEEGNIEEGDILNIYCSVLHGSLPITFKWYSFLGTLLYNTSSHQKSGVYKVERAGKEHDSGYYCEATNQSNLKSVSRVFIVQVKMASWKKGVIALFCLLVLAAIVGIVWYKVKRGRSQMATELSVKPSSPKPDDSVTMSLTHDTDGFYAHSGSELSEEEKLNEVEYTEVIHPQPASTSEGPWRKGTDTVYSELQNSCQGAESRLGSQDAVEYAQLNHDEALIM